MTIAFIALTTLVALLHFWFMILESVLWTKPLGLKTFAMKREQAEATRVLALNQGIYNGLLSVGLLTGLFVANHFMVGFLLAYVVVVGIVGALSVSKSIFFVQSLPAILALGALCAR